MELAHNWSREETEVGHLYLTPSSFLFSRRHCLAKLPRLTSNSRFYLSPPSSWDYRCAPACPAYPAFSPVYYSTLILPSMFQSRKTRAPVSARGL